EVGTLEALQPLVRKRLQLIHQIVAHFMRSINWQIDVIQAELAVYRKMLRFCILIVTPRISPYFRSMAMNLNAIMELIEPERNIHSGDPLDAIRGHKSVGGKQAVPAPFPKSRH